MEARATVVRVADGLVWLRLEDRPGGCGRCGEPGGCRSTRLTDIFSTRDLYCLPDSLGSRAGDGVRIVVADGAPLRAALITYLLPMALMLGLGAAAQILAPFENGDANVLAGVTVGLLAGLAGARCIMGAGWRERGMGLSLRPATPAVPSCGGRS